MSNHLFGRYRYCGSLMLIVIYTSNMGKSSQYHASPTICKISYTDTYIIVLTSYEVIDRLRSQSYNIAGIVLAPKDFFIRISYNESFILYQLKTYPNISHIHLVKEVFCFLPKLFYLLGILFKKPTAIGIIGYIDGQAIDS